MKIKIISFLSILLLIVTPSLVLAENCSSTSISGSNGSDTTSSGSSSGCTAVCYWTNATGFRIGLYYYDGTGTPQLLGHNVDVWGASSVDKVLISDGKYSDPNRSMLALKGASDCGLKENYTWSDNQFNLGWETYKNNRQTKFEDQADLHSIMRNGGLNNYLLNSNASGGWIYVNIFEPLIAKNTEKDTKFNELWGVSANQIRSSSDNVYIVAEVLYKVYAGAGGRGYRTSKTYLGTASEHARQIGYTNPYRMLHKNTTEGKLVTNNGPLRPFDVSNKVYSSFGIYVGQNSLIKYTNSGESWATDNDYIRDKTACGYTIGMGVWHLSSRCDDCGESCTTDCGDLKGTARNNCAKKWCKKNDNSNYDDCYSACSVGVVNKSIKCDKNYEDKCETYKKADGTTTIKTATGKKCEEDQEKNVKKYEFSTMSCYPDKTDYELTKSKFYKIECYETQVIDNIPVPTKITSQERTINVLSNGKYVNRDTLTYNVYAGMSITYTKKCDLYYLNKNGTDKTKKYSKSYVKEELSNTEKQLKTDEELLDECNKDLAAERKKDNKSKKYENLKNKCDAISEAIQDENEYIKKLKKVQDTAINELQEKLKGNKDYSHLIDNSDVVSIDTSDENDSNITGTVYTTKMKPVSCKNTKFDGTYKECSTGTLPGTKVKCDGTTNYTKTESAITGGTLKRESDLSIEDSYYGFFTNGDTKIYRSLSACEAAVKPTNGYCKVISNAYVVENDGSVNFMTTSNVLKKIRYKITLNGTGDCGQFKFDMTCPVEIMKKQVCDIDFTIATVNEKQEYKDNCECIAYCGSNVACREKYCPNPCPECNTPKDDICNKCDSECDDKYIKTSLDNKVCKKDCCNLKCNGNKSCLNKCCENYCEAQYVKDSAEYKNCIKNKCEGGTGEDYYYRTINPDDPFPNRKPGQQNLGANWIDKENFITKDNSDNALYRDKTNGRSKDEYEYKVVITKDGVKNLRKTFRTNTSYMNKVRAKDYTTKKSSDGSKVYCSKFIHETVTLGSASKYEGVQITIKGNDYGMGCVK